jgi:site-specific recombinase XerD
MSEPLLEDLRSYLTERGYRPVTVHRYAAGAAQFLVWLGEHPPEERCLDAAAVRRFLEAARVAGDPRAGPTRRPSKELRAGLNRLLNLCGEASLRAPAESASAPIEALVTRFDAYLDRVCGLAESTRHFRRRCARAFLSRRFADGWPEPSTITPADLVTFVVEQARGLRPSSVGAVACSLRSLMRFLRFEGELPVDLAEAIPHPPQYCLAALPRGLSEAELERFWAAFDRATPIGRRDWAMARCLADLGLRCGEVAALRLEDIDWRAAVVHLVPGKCRRAAQLPLPAATGAALADYLRAGRPESAERALFVHHRAPLGAAVTKCTVRGAIRRAFARAHLPWTGPHVLRRTAAARLVQEGRSLKLVADVLRHRSLDTAAIYAKVDLPALARVPLPWPGRSL